MTGRGNAGLHPAREATVQPAPGLRQKRMWNLAGLCRRKAVVLLRSFTGSMLYR